jgi:hypothetical protein
MASNLSTSVMSLKVMRESLVRLEELQAGNIVTEGLGRQQERHN